MDAASRTDSGPEIDPARPAGRPRRWLVAAAAALLLAPGLAACSLLEDETPAALGDPVAAEVVVDELEATDESEAIDPTAAEPGSDGSYAFNMLAADGATPVSYDPCRPISYVVRPDGAPAEGDQLLREAIDMVADATGLTFVYEGETDEAPTPDGDRDFYQYERYGDRIAPVLIAWSDDAEAPELGSDDGGESETLGYAYSDATHATDDASDTAPIVYVTGEVVLDAPDLQWELEEGEGYEYVRAVIAHELAHLVGLDHVDDPGQLMNPMMEGLVEFGPGDLEGLAILGQGRCYPD